MYCHPNPHAVQGLLSLPLSSPGKTVSLGVLALFLTCHLSRRADPNDLSMGELSLPIMEELALVMWVWKRWPCLLPKRGIQAETPTDQHRPTPRVLSYPTPKSTPSMTFCNLWKDWSGRSIAHGSSLIGVTGYLRIFCLCSTVDGVAEARGLELNQQTTHCNKNLQVKMLMQNVTLCDILLLSVPVMMKNIWDGEAGKTEDQNIFLSMFLFS